MLVYNWPSCRNFIALCHSFLCSVTLGTDAVVETAPVRHSVSPNPAEVTGNWKHSVLLRKISGPHSHGRLNHLKKEIGAHVISWATLQQESITRSFSIVGPSPEKKKQVRSNGLYLSFPTALISNYSFIILLMLSTFLLVVWYLDWKPSCTLEQRF